MAKADDIVAISGTARSPRPFKTSVAKIFSAACLLTVPAFDLPVTSL
jgi:hypothetical protein